MLQAFKRIRVLVVEDDEISQEVVEAYLVNDGISVTCATSIESAVREFKHRHFDLVLVDVNLPDGLGFDLVTVLRQHRDCPVIYLTSRVDPSDRVRGLDTGGDDYIVKPFHLGELSSRIKAVLRRCQSGLSPANAVIDLSGSTLDLMRRELADQEGKLVPLTRGEFDIFSALVQASPISLDRDYLLEVLDTAESTASLRTIDVMISRIRAKIEPSRMSFRIVTTRGSGYRVESSAP